MLVGAEKSLNGFDKFMADWVLSFEVRQRKKRAECLKAD